MSDFPKVFQDFCRDQCIDLSIYDRHQRQYFYSQANREEIEADSVYTVGKAVPLLHPQVSNFYTVEPVGRAFKFSSSELYRAGKLLPMDLSSGLAVFLLNLRPSDHLLDLCCAPGGKLVLASHLQAASIADFADNPERIGTLTGVDLSLGRLATCRSLVKKYRVPAVRLFCEDGTRFNVRPKTFYNRNTLQKDSHDTDPDTDTSRIHSDHSLHSLHSVHSLNSVHSVHGLSLRPFHESTWLRKRPTQGSTTRLYDKVLVDAQCTHDGSVKHIQKHRSNDWKDMDLSQFAPESLEKLYQLQFNLLSRGFELLAEDGILIYSTCSLSRRQNEDVICKFLEKWQGMARPLPFDDSDEFGQLRLCPPIQESGFFICRIQKQRQL
jgi:16S rRNA C967 or C1407 C5-methylase (RsmB/RsmF family)